MEWSGPSPKENAESVERRVATCMRNSDNRNV